MWVNEPGCKMWGHLKTLFTYNFSGSHSEWMKIQKFSSKSTLSQIVKHCISVHS